ncbi:TIGR04282 family arsenosugar biosynthesis glycosyltransferase [Flavicella sp.]|uniref:TIGR04282 family arsenosugar biosynthesis glycosyltransferase n=1 Tax=Flavicella sp. TaxID=2957742 RepID=UPI00262EC78B|nr:TIGR04282 family arsenosugar biosynthesis glycosyltransferase [Flavicella sp.]MDG1805699.1 TIGR04282 family arsenosugar biosynthesis glycosyltransferase [Flavicella sp.]
MEKRCMKNKNLLILFTRNPELGKVKTRLAASIGDQKALDIYKELLSHTQNIALNVNADKNLYYSESVVNFDDWDETIFSKKAQRGNDLGEKMLDAFKDGFSKGYEKIIIIGSDIYDLQTSHICKAFDDLEKFDTVLGPAQDGGYYLLGTKQLIPELYKNKKWGTESVLKDTIADLDGLFSVSFLETLNDIDVISDINPDSYLGKYL